MQSWKASSKITEDWSMDYEKKILIRKYHTCGELVAECLLHPENEDLLRRTASYLLSFVLSIPCSVRTYKLWKEGKLPQSMVNIKEKMIIGQKLRNIYLILTTHPTKRVVEFAKSMGIRFKKVKTATGENIVVANPQKIALMLAEIYELTGAVAYSSGLRLRFPEEKVLGMEKIKEEEGLEEDEIDELLRGVE